MGKSYALTALVVLIINLMSVGKGFSYSFSQDIQQGFYWASFPFRFKKFVADATYGPMLSSLTDQAANEWEWQTGLDLWNVDTDYIEGTNYSGNFIRWSFDFENETGFDGQSTLAVTTRWSQGTNIVRTTIILNGNNESLFNNIDNSLYATILHELGHTIGLGHSDMPAVMQASLGFYRTLQQDDVVGAIDVYEVQVSRQESGFVSPLAFTSSGESDDGLGIAGCGTINMQGPGANGPGSMGGLFIFMLGLLSAISSLGRRRLSFLTAHY